MICIIVVWVQVKKIILTYIASGTRENEKKKDIFSWANIFHSEM